MESPDDTTVRTEYGERTCQTWRCKNSCWGLPGCMHPERTAFYNRPMPDFDSLLRQEARRKKYWFIARIIIWAAIALEVIFFGVQYL